MAHRVLALDIEDQKVNFSLQQRSEGGSYYPLDRRSYELKLDPLVENTINLLVKLQHLLADALRRSGKLKRAEVDEALHTLITVLGQHLYNVLFTEHVDTRLNDSLRDLPSKELLRIELTFQGSSEPSRSSWPWEYLFSPKEEQFVALLGDLVLSRQLVVKVSPSPFTTAKPKVLLVVARPWEEGPVDGQPVIDKVRELRDAGVIELVELIEPRPSENAEVPPAEYQPTASSVRFKELVEEGQPHIIHFIGHGQCEGPEGQVAFVGAGGKAHWVSGKDFAALASESKQLKLVFLQACESALPDPDPHSPSSSVARELFRSGIPAVVAMQAKVENQAANTFACKFYESIGERKPVDSAVMEGRKAIREKAEAQNEPKKDATDRSTAFGVPVLYLRRFEPLIAPEPSSGPRPVGSKQLQEGPAVARACPRCHAPVLREDQKVCTRCELRLWCANPECPRGKLDDPLGKICGECSTPIPASPPWSLRLEDQLLTGTAMPSATPPPGASETTVSVPPASLQALKVGRSGIM